MPLNLSLSPGQVEFATRPGTTFTQAYNITNDSDSPQILTASVLPWSPVDDSGNVHYLDTSPYPGFSFSLANSDIQLHQPFVLPPHSKQQLVLKVVAANNSGTDGYFTFFVTQDNSGRTTSDTTGSQAFGRLGSHLLIKSDLKDTIENHLTPTSLQVSPLITDIFFPSVIINSKISNSGNHFQAMDGKLSLSYNHKVVSEKLLFPSNVLAGHQRSALCLSQDSPADCTFSPPFWPGIYTVQIELKDTPPVSANFFVFPFSLILFILGGLLILRTTLAKR